MASRTQSVAVDRELVARLRRERPEFALTKFVRKAIKQELDRTDRNDPAAERKEG
jgi:hypothetical protein